MIVVFTLLNTTGPPAWSSTLSSQTLSIYESAPVGTTLFSVSAYLNGDSSLPLDCSYSVPEIGVRSLPVLLPETLFKLQVQFQVLSFRSLQGYFSVEVTGNHTSFCTLTASVAVALDYQSAFQSGSFHFYAKVRS